MSYILDALKKSQAERQLGELPTIDAVPEQGASARHGGAARGRWLTLALAGIALLLGAVLYLLWRQPAQPVPPAPAAPRASVAAPAPVTGSAAVVSSAPAPAPVAAWTPPEPAALPRAAEPAPVAAVPPARAPRAAAPASRPAAVAAAAPAPAAPAVVAAPARDDNIGLLYELPEAIQRQIPPVTFGGYIYSKNPADRLLLIDRVLRHEGEEISPGLVLEKLQPKGAVMNYRGYRYRQPY